jgi:hypothetical protein
MKKYKVYIGSTEISTAQVTVDAESGIEAKAAVEKMDLSRLDWFGPEPTGEIKYDIVEVK